MRLPLLETLAVSLLLACSTSDETVDRAEGAQKVKPTGTDATGKLKVVLPAGGPAVDRGTSIVNLLDGEGEVGTSLELAIGRHSFDLRTEGNGFGARVSGFAEIAANKTTIVKLGVLAPKASNGTPTFGLGKLEADGLGVVVRRSDITTRDEDDRDVAGITGTLDGSRGLPLLEGEYEVSFGLFDGVPVVLAPGETKVVNLLDTKDREIARLKAPIRELPDACGAAEDWLVSNRSGFSRPFRIEPGDEVDLGISPRHAGEAYFWRTSSMKEAVFLPVGKRGAGPLLFEVGRIDVEDVLVDGKERIRGSWHVMRADASGAAESGSLLRCIPETNTGVDLPKGRYRVEVVYQLPKNGEKVDVHIVNLP